MECSSMGVLDAKSSMALCIYIIWYSFITYVYSLIMAIHIKKENKGKFTATKKRTGKTTEQLTHSKNPLTRKRAIFAQNAARWNKKKK